MAGIGFRQGELAPYAKPGHFNDPDMLEIGNGGMTDTEYRTHMSLWSMLASPLLAGNDLRTMTPTIHDILVNREGLATIHEQLEGRGYLPPFTGSKHLRDTELGVKVEFLVSGGYPGDGQPKPVAWGVW